MTAKDFRQKQDYSHNHFTKLTSTGISSDYDHIEAFAEAYHQSKIEILGIGFYYLKAGDTVKNGDEYYKIEDGEWYMINDADDGYEFEPEYMYATRRKEHLCNKTRLTR